MTLCDQAQAIGRAYATPDLIHGIDWIVRLQRLSDELNFADKPLYRVKLDKKQTRFLDVVYKAAVWLIPDTPMRFDGGLCFNEEDAKQAAAQVACVTLLPLSQYVQVVLKLPIPLPLQLGRYLLPQQQQVIEHLRSFLQSDAANLFLVVPRDNRDWLYATLLFMASYQTDFERAYPNILYTHYTQTEATEAFDAFRHITALQVLSMEDHQACKVVLRSTSDGDTRPLCCYRFPAWTTTQKRALRGLGGVHTLQIYNPPVTAAVCADASQWQRFLHTKSVWLLLCTDLSSAWHQRMQSVSKQMLYVTSTLPPGKP
jgi:hypothetical protein